MSRFSETNRGVVEAITQYAASHPMDGSRKSIQDFFPRVDPQTVRLMFDLSYLTYYDKSDRSFTPNYVSTPYEQQLLKVKGRVAALERRLRNITQFNLDLNRVFGSDVIRYVEQRRIESQEDSDRRHQGSSAMEGRYDQKFGLHSGGTDGRVDFDQTHGGGSKNSGVSMGQDRGRTDVQRTETMDMKVRNLTPDLLREQAVNFNRLVADDETKIADPNNTTLNEIEGRVGIVEGKIKYELVEARRAVEILSDPIAGEYWVKVERVFSRELEGFTPVDILYRSLTKYKKPFFGAGIAAAKRNKGSDLGGKEVSGVILYRDAEPTDSTKNTDQLIISFSGSNSEEDWLHNFDAGRSQGKANHSLAVGYRVHQGIMNSLNESLDYMGTNLKGWFKNYVKSHPVGSDGKIPTLRIAVTGHSLGGGLAMLMALLIKDQIAPVYEGRINIDVVVYTFGAPPIFDKDFAQKAEDRLGKRNVIRVWNEGDPVSTMSIVFKNEKIFKRSLLMTLLGYAHIGTSIPLVDREGLASFWDKLNPWSNHVADRYANLLATNWKDLTNKKAREVYEYLTSRDLLKIGMLRSSLDDMGQFVRNRNDAAMPLQPFLVGDIVEMMRDTDAKFQPNNGQSGNANTIQNYDSVRDTRYSEGKKAAPKLAGAEEKGLTYSHELQTGQKIPMKLNRSTSCSAKDIVKTVGLNPNQFDPRDIDELSCGCCLAKNFFVSADSSLTSKFRSLFGKRISTVDQVYKHCSARCSPLVGTIFADKNKANVMEIGDLMDRMGLGDMWRAKKLKP